MKDGFDSRWGYWGWPITRSGSLPLANKGPSWYTVSGASNTPGARLKAGITTVLPVLTCRTTQAHIVQSGLERLLAKQQVAGSNPAVCSLQSTKDFMAKSDYGKSPRSAADTAEYRERWAAAIGDGTHETGIFIWCGKCERVVKRGNHDNCR